MRTFPFSSFQDITKKTRTRRFGLFGGGTIATKMFRKLDKRPDFVFDNNPAMWGLVENDVEISKPEDLKSFGDDKPFIIICTTSFGEVGEQLVGYGYEPNVDFIVSPIMNDLRIISELEEHQAKLLFTSGSPPIDNPKFGGGIYELTMDGDFEYRKVHSGNVHGIIPFEGNFIAIDDDIGIIELDTQYNVVRTGELPPAARGHGVAYSEATEKFYVVASYMDKVLEFDRDLKQTGEICLSGKFSKTQTAFHHTNDITISGTSAYVSMFSVTGNWKQDVFDGGIMEFDLESGEHLGTLTNQLWMPHNVDIIDGGIVVLDSLRGNFLRNNLNVTGTFPGFTRGLGYDGQFFFIGQSRNRNYSKNMGLSNNISIDASIILFDDTTKVSRTMQLPSKVSEIHAILAITHV